MDKQKLEAEKMALVWQLNTLQEKIMKYWIDIDVSSDAFKDIIELRESLKEKINKINKILADNQ